MAHDHDDRCPDEPCGVGTKLAELAQRIDDVLGQTGNGAAVDCGAIEQRIADALGVVERGLDPANARGAIRELHLDEEEGQTW